ncbi:MAG: hypothetical protein HC884_13585 [Chloroflexaceae bacterium]|nr:hypothetical protein [Chloroflexaceae bacterium]
MKDHPLNGSCPIPLLSSSLSPVSPRSRPLSLLLVGLLLASIVLAGLLRLSGAAFAAASQTPDQRIRVAQETPPEVGFAGGSKLVPGGKILLPISLNPRGNSGIEKLQFTVHYDHEALNVVETVTPLTSTVEEGITPDTSSIDVAYQDDPVEGQFTLVITKTDVPFHFQKSSPVVHVWIEARGLSELPDQGLIPASVGVVNGTCRYWSGGVEATCSPLSSRLDVLTELEAFSPGASDPTILGNTTVLTLSAATGYSHILWDIYGDGSVIYRKTTQPDENFRILETFFYTRTSQPGTPFIPVAVMYDKDDTAILTGTFDTGVVVQVPDPVLKVEAPVYLDRTIDVTLTLHPELLRRTGAGGTDEKGVYDGVQWDFGDGTTEVRGPDETLRMSHTYTRTGVYQVRTVAFLSRGGVYVYGAGMNLASANVDVKAPEVVLEPVGRDTPTLNLGEDIAFKVTVTNFAYRTEKGGHLEVSFGDGSAPYVETDIQPVGGILEVMVPTHTYTQVGQYPVTAQLVYDGLTRANEGTDSLNVTVRHVPVALSMGVWDDRLRADGLSTTVITAYVQAEQQGTLVAMEGQEVVFALEPADLGTIVNPRVTTGADGMAQTELRAGQKKGKAVVTASAGELEASDRVALVEYTYIPFITNSDDS